MGFFSPPKDKSAQIARQQELEREGKISEGRVAIDKNFAQFTPDYFAKISDAYGNFYIPQLEQQMADAREQLIYGLARSGNLNASAGARSLADLRTAYEKNKALIGDRAIGAGNQARADTESNRGELYSQLSASADPSAAATTSAARAAALTAPPQYSPLGDLFSSFLNQASNQVAGAQQGYSNLASGLFKPKSSVSVIT